MMWYAIPSLLTVSFVLAVAQWRWTRKAPRREKVAYWVLTAIGWTIGVLLYLFPHLPGPSQFVDYLFGRLGTTLINRGQAGT
ncbi:hypothetical protein I8J29_22510 [Paenibacillus sp. MWE-103]|uniref:Uncharacterized protein n=1 Tax=Paenibacillus artemisiicola TaxID=1172618 RepID=A0ABS3WFU0_9BACL|nr:hypothetical protein [Paenibacillus artemisiicola]MBO7746980.1 hypothetical protein [Paenibacillus artemisiicola]